MPLNFLLLLKPYYNKLEKAIPSILIGNFFNLVLILILTVLSFGVFRVNLVTDFIYPSYNLSRTAVRGLDIIIFILWLGITVFQLAIFIFGPIKVITEYFELNNYQMIKIPFLIMSLALVIYHDKFTLVYLDIKYLIITLYFIVQSFILGGLIIGYLVANSKVNN